MDLNRWPTDDENGEARMRGYYWMMVFRREDGRSSVRFGILNTDEEGKPVWHPHGTGTEFSAEEMESNLGNHYSGSYPAARWRFGIYHRGGELAGVAVFSMPTSNKVLSSIFPGELLESVELGRLVLLDLVPGNGETWFLRQCFRALKVEHGIRGVVSFSDPVARQDSAGVRVFPGHIGGIYQAHNGAYLGRATRRTLDLLPDGTVFHDYAAQKIRQLRKGWRYAVARLPEALALFAERMKQVQIEHDDAIKVIQRYDDPGTVIYADPPYTEDVRSKWAGRAYEVEATTEQHIALADAMNGLKGYGLVSGKVSDLYIDLYERRGWKREEKQVMDVAGNHTVESLWLCPRTVHALHLKKSGRPGQLMLLQETT